MEEVEREKVFLVKRLPKGLKKPILIQVGDLSEKQTVSSLKVRQKGNYFELIKKYGSMNQKRVEHKIEISKEEFNIILKAASRKHRKKRYFYKYMNYTIEIDLYKDELDGYVRAEVEFKSKKDMKNFVAPPWFADEITDINHVIHKGLGKITFKDLKERYKKKGIVLKKIKG